MLNISKKTKIVCTIGPASDSYQMVKKLVKAGMNVMRINFSHGSYEEHWKKIQIVKRLQKKFGIYIPVMLDTKGPEIRCQLFENGGVDIARNHIIRVSMTPLLGNKEVFSISYPGLFDDVKIADHLKIDDGKLDLQIIQKDVSKRELLCKALNAHFLKDRKGINAPFARLTMPFISVRDEEDLKWGCAHGIAMVAASFTRRKQDILDIKALLAKYHHPEIQVIAKIENREALDNFEEILSVVDGIMVARGDLGVEIPPEEVPVVQELLIRRCREIGKPVITATQMLDSMQTHPIPTRAEVSDVATAIRESTDAIMLSAESASGDYPLEAVQMQAKISATMEKNLDYTRLAAQAYATSSQNNSDAIANSVANTANLINAALIFCFSETGLSGNRIAKNRPSCPIIVLTHKPSTAQKLGLVWGIQTIVINQLPQLIEDMEALALVKAHDLKIPAGAPIIITGGTPTGTGGTNFMRIVRVNQIKDI
ncbi:MAG: pyruvate kinase [Bacilli bacterium]|jgi:pyruvate kinase|nr:pyruvate kinase [Bacilli bacterium]MDD3388785.1 pyruvate kinase [Bacilli bacterium]MDD4344575.1 pyruvate kinase [Bacilli bacterium]MDD4520469.1 pyruvate kinase [Bacilli bacterium]MDY0399116.1 pyruvate kinase [Bacilli bacterium]